MNTLYDWHCTIICTYYDCVLLSCCVNMLFTPVNTAAPIRCSPANSINLSQCPNENSNDDCSCRLFDANMAEFRAVQTTSLPLQSSR